MIEKLVTRLMLGLLLAAAVTAGALAIPFVMALGRRGVAGEIGSAASCMLNALFGGPRTATFSAWSFELALRGKDRGKRLVRFIDRLQGAGHCADAWVDHRKRGLIAERGA